MSIDAFIANMEIRKERLRKRVEAFEPCEILTDRRREAAEDFLLMSNFVRALRASDD